MGVIVRNVKVIADEIYSDLNHVDPKFSPKTYDAEAVFQSLDNIIFTRKKERLFNPEFGSDIEEMLFELDDDIAEFEAYNKLIRAIKRWDDRIILIFPHTSVKRDPDNHIMYITIVFKIRGMEETVYTYQRELNV